jgi:transcriptional regulator with XRE-family HTH domain
MTSTAEVLVQSGTLADDVGLRELREERLLSQQELAIRAGVSKTTIVNIETGKIRPHPATLRKLAETLQVDPAALAEHLRRTQP